ncbi:hypothetical protein CALVIDRAFT_565283 [Calocera viscosa TUFC12733]|uniref:Checkpoint protein n=1 Tax=Calocera viscosa (strain TUFC12733) TaxID=1330018 RepID=A0A167KQ53_CALVF|nr:hypothetical protein CALVIDRAFT_565283 [Calocera viscosa TUFC12733]
MSLKCRIAREQVEVLVQILAASRAISAYVDVVVDMCGVKINACKTSPIVQYQAVLHGSFFDICSASGEDDLNDDRGDIFWEGSICIASLMEDLSHYLQWSIADGVLVVFDVVGGNTEAGTEGGRTDRRMQLTVFMEGLNSTKSIAYKVLEPRKAVKAAVDVSSYGRPVLIQLRDVQRIARILSDKEEDASGELSLQLRGDEFVLGMHHSQTKTRMDFRLPMERSTLPSYIDTRCNAQEFASCLLVAAALDRVVTLYLPCETELPVIIYLKAPLETADSYTIHYAVESYMEPLDERMERLCAKLMKPLVPPNARS